MYYYVIDNFNRNINRIYDESDFLKLIKGYQYIPVDIKNFKFKFKRSKLNLESCIFFDREHSPIVNLSFFNIAFKCEADLKYEGCSKEEYENIEREIKNNRNSIKNNNGSEIRKDVIDLVKRKLEGLNKEKSKLNDMETEFYNYYNNLSDAEKLLVHIN